MAQTLNINIYANTWTELTNADVSAVRVSNVGSAEILLKGTVGSVVPVDDGGGIPLAPDQTLLGDIPLSSLWLEPSGVNRVWALSQFDAIASVSHADA